VSVKLVERDPVWIFGCGRFGRDVAKALVGEGFRVAGFLESQPRLIECDGLPVRAANSLSPRESSAQVVLGVFNREVSYAHLLRDCGLDRFERLQFPWDTYAQVGHRLGWRYWLSDPSILRSFSDRVERVIDSLADLASRESLRRIFNFRLGQDLEYSCFRHQDPQYFNSLTLVPRAAEGWFVDGGAYDGDSFAQFLSSVRTIEPALLFEPEGTNYRALISREEVRKSSSLCLPLALSDYSRQLRFRGASGEAASIDANGETIIQAVALDEICRGHKVGFIKLDVEGAERDAIRGAERVIRTSRPVLAMSLYHRFDDLWILPELLNEFCAGYALHVRQHYFNSFDCVLYAVPRESAVSV
jgi:FkbM family methyltransferase